MTHRVFGVRHHGPGSARSLLTAFEAWRPDCVLVEGPPDAAAVLPLAAHPQMRPPVALLVYARDEPGSAAFYPFATFSPEWQALRWALAAQVPVRFIDLPVASSLALPPAPPAAVSDPLRLLAEAAGHSDPERWWEDVVEHRTAGDGPFEAVTEAMASLREGEQPGEREAQREASMRRHIRAARREGFDRVAVVCGAWHAPALVEPLRPAAADTALLRGLPRVKVAATWVPWTHDRLAFRSGYGAGVTSPGWYALLFDAPDAVVERWMTAAARLLRAEDLPASPAAVVDGVRLAEALAALRARPLPGLDELTDAARAVLTGGSDVPLAVVANRLVVGQVLGEVPDETPMVPLQEDVVRSQRRLRLRPEASARDLELDLRRSTDLARSHLLHRLVLLDVPWGTPERVSGARGTFRERWRLLWQPELSVRLIEASMWGTTVPAAACAFAERRAGLLAELGPLAALAERCLLADLPAAVRAVMRVFSDRAALDADVGHLMDALPPLARVVRYGDVRGTDEATVRDVVDGLVARVVVGLPPACASLDDAAAAAMVDRVGEVAAALALLQRDDLRRRWEAALAAVADRPAVHGLVTGRCTRLLLDAGRLAPEEAARRMSVSLSPAEDPGRAAAWLEGFLAGSGLILLHDRSLLRLLDEWMGGVPAARFQDVLPLLRRTFASFPAAERRQIGERLRAGPRVDVEETGVALDPARAESVVPVVSLLLGRQRG